MRSDLAGITKIVIETHWRVGEQETDEMMRKLISDGFFINLDLSDQHVRNLWR